MRRLLLYPDPAPSPLDVAPLAIDPACGRCSLGRGCTTRCLPPEASSDLGGAGTLLVIVDSPALSDEKVGRPMGGLSGAWIRKLLPTLWPGPIVLDHAVKCHAGDASPLDAVDECRPYLAATVAEAVPDRILCLGAVAYAGVTGHHVVTANVMRGYGWVTVAGKDVPAFVLPAPSCASRNRFHRAQFGAALRWAVTVDVASLNSPGEARSGHALVASTPPEALDVLALMSRAKRWVSFDAEWAGRPFDFDFHVLSIAFSLAPRDPLLDEEPDLSWCDSYVITPSAWRGREGAPVRTAIRAWLGDAHIGKAGINLKSDAGAMRAEFGAVLRGTRIDGRFVRRMLESEAAADLATTAHLVGQGGHKDSMKVARIAAANIARRMAAKGETPDAIVDVLSGIAGAPIRGTAEHVERIVGGADVNAYGFGLVAPDVLDAYNGRDTVTTASVCDLLEARLDTDNPNIKRVWASLAAPAIDALAQVEAWGLPVDAHALRAFGDFLTAGIGASKQRLSAITGEEFNPNSPEQVRTLLYVTLKLPVDPKRMTVSGKPSTDADTLEHLAPLHSVVGDLLRYRKLTKLKGVYADGKEGNGGLIEHIRGDGCLHPTIHPDGARTGRTSASNPNLQNIPRADTHEGKLLRDCFRAPHGWSLVELDHSQLELRIAADQSGDREMLKIFISGDDYHLRTAQLLAPLLWQDIDPASISKDDPRRTTAKTLNFAVLFDDDPHGLAFRLGVSVTEATRIRDALFGRFKGLARYIEDRVRESSKSGEAWTWWDGGPARRRDLSAVDDADDQACKTARRGSWNTPIQGTGSDFLLAGLVKVVNWIVDEGIAARVCVPIHDSILSVVRDDALEEYLYTASRLMTDLPTRNGVPLVVDAKVGRTWGEMKKVKLP